MAKRSKSKKELEKRVLALRASHDEIGHHIGAGNTEATLNRLEQARNELFALVDYIDAGSFK